MSTRTPDCGTRLADGVTRGSVWGLSWGLFSAETGGAGFQAARSISMSMARSAGSFAAIVGAYQGIECLLDRLNFAGDAVNAALAGGIVVSCTTVGPRYSRTVFERKATGALLGLIPIIGYIAWRTSEGSDPVSKAHSEESDSASFPRDAVARYASRSSCKQVISQCLVPRPAGLRDFVSWFKNSNSPPPPDEAE